MFGLTEKEVRNIMKDEIKRVFHPGKEGSWANALFKDKIGEICLALLDCIIQNKTHSIYSTGTISTRFRETIDEAVTEKTEQGVKDKTGTEAFLDSIIERIKNKQL